MITTQLQLFTRSLAAHASLTQDGIVLSISAEDKAELEDYLRMVLPHYLERSVDQLSFEALFAAASEWQQAHPDLPLSEPTSRVQYYIRTSVKRLLKQLSTSRSENQTQTFISLIDQGYERFVLQNQPFDRPEPLPVSSTGRPGRPASQKTESDVLVCFLRLSSRLKLSQMADHMGLTLGDVISVLVDEEFKPTP